MKLAVIFLGVLIFIVLRLYFSKNSTKREEEERKSKEILNRIVQDEYKDKLSSVVDLMKGDIYNIKALRDKYGLTLVDSKELLDRIKENVKLNRFSEDYSDIENVVDRTKGDIHNIKVIREYYQIDVKKAKDLWDSIK